MTENEARTVLGIMFTTDDDCPYCASKLVHAFIYSFPQFEAIAKEEYTFTFDRPL